jgi:HlyD family secretion protein
MVPSLVDAVHVQPGDAVAPDTVLVTLADPTVESSFAQAKANVANAEADRASMQALLTSELLSLQTAPAGAHVQAKTETPKEWPERSLYQSHIISALTYETIQLQSEEYGRVVDLAERRITAFRQSMKAKDGAAAERLIALHAALDNSLDQVKVLTVVAGISGVVQTIPVHAGQTLATGANIARVASLKALKVRLEVPANEAGEMAAGQPVMLELAANDGQPLQRRVTRMSPVVSHGGVDVDEMPDGPLPASVRPIWRLPVRFTSRLSATPYTLNARLTLVRMSA